MRHKISVTEPIIKSRAEMESLVGEIAALMIEHNKATCVMDAERLKIAQQYEDRLARLQTRIDEKMIVAADWAQKNLAEFGKKRSINFVHAKAGFRKGTPKLKPISKAYTDDLIIEFLQRSVWGSDYIRDLPTIDPNWWRPASSSLSCLFSCSREWSRSSFLSRATTSSLKNGFWM